MAGGYRAQPRNGFEDIRARQVATARAVAAARTAGSLRSSSITGGNGLTVKSPNGQAIQLKVVDDDNSQILFSPPDAQQVGDWAAQIGFNPVGYAGGGLFLNSPSSPTGGVTGFQPNQQVSMSLESGDGLTEPATLFINVGGGVGGSMALNVFGGSASFGLAPRVEIGSSFRFEDDSFAGASARLFMGVASLVAPYSVAELRVRDNTNSAYVPIRASAFTVTSSRDAKDRVTDFGWSPLDVVRRAKAKRWHYLPEHGDPDRVHFGPMAEDLPDDLVDNTDETPAIDLAAMVGVLWGAVQELAAEVAQLRKEATA